MDKAHVDRLHKMAEIAYCLDGAIEATQEGHSDEAADCADQMLEAERELRQGPQDKHSQDLLQQLQRIRPLPRVKNYGN